MRRREFIGLLAGQAAFAPKVARAQQRAEMRCVGVLFGEPRDPVSEANYNIIRRVLNDFGWMEGSNIRIEARWGGGDIERTQSLAAELLTFKPDVIFTGGIRALDEQRRLDRRTPIIFIATTDPVAQGFAQSLSRPGGNTTGFLLFEFSVIGKLLDGLKEIAPNCRRAALLINPANRSTTTHTEAFESAVRSLGLQPAVIAVRDRAEIEPAIDGFASGGSAALILPPDVFMLANRELIARTANLRQVPLIAAEREFVHAGGLMAYGVDRASLYRQAAGYVDRVLRGAPPGGLPIQAPTKFELLINLKTAKALGLEIPDPVLLQADEVVE